VKVKVPQWGFKLNPDLNDSKLWPDRHDKINNFYYYDADQNWQVEKHYQDCCSKNKIFEDKYIITGDAN
jgi:hypothetical protein